MTCASQDAILEPMKRVSRSVASEAAAAMARRRASLMTREQREEQGRNAGRVGGPARARKLSKEQRQAIARKAAEARWGRLKAGK